jgi:hypothetical protein
MVKFNSLRLNGIFRQTKAKSALGFPSATVHKPIFQRRFYRSGEAEAHKKNLCNDASDGTVKKLKNLQHQPIKAQKTSFLANPYTPR